MPRLGMLGTLVLDTIHGPDAGQAPVRDWGGIAYSLAAFEAAAPPGWSLVPLIKVGADVRPEADALISGLDRVSSLEGVVTVPEANNRVELFYRDPSRRCEKLTGGVPGWTWEELEGPASCCDALYVNFISGWELDRVAVAGMRRRFPGPTYADVHSLILDVGPDGVRAPRPLRRRREWLGPFNLVQVNEEELAMLSTAGAGRRSMAEDVLADGPEVVFITLGAAGAAWACRARTRWAPEETGVRELGDVLYGESAGEPIGPAGLDPTGCGDIWGVACFTSLLAGTPLAESVRRANRLASRAAASRGTAGLAGRLAVSGATARKG